MDRRHWLGLLGPIKKWLRANGHEGVDCPCCGQFVKFYKRRMNATLARCLIWIVTYHEINCDGDNPWVAVYEKGPRFVVRQGGYGAGMLANWGLIEPLASDDASKRNSGMWKPTKLGIDFVHDRVRIPAWVEVFDNRVRDVALETVSIREALGKKFDYAKLMSLEGS